MDEDKLCILKDPAGKPGLAEKSGSCAPEEEKVGWLLLKKNEREKTFQNICLACNTSLSAVGLHTSTYYETLVLNSPMLQKTCISSAGEEDLNTNGPWSQRTISRLLRNTLNPRMKRLLPGHSRDDDGEEERNFVGACDLASGPSAPIRRVSVQWQHVGGAQRGSPEVCAKGRTVPGDGLLVVPASPFLNKHYQSLWRLVEQRSLLLFIHEYTRRVHSTTAYISKVAHLLDDHLRKSHLLSSRSPHLCSSAKVQLVSLCQEFRIHLNHWSCLSAKVQSDHHLRRALGWQNKLLEEMRQTLKLLGLQGLVLTERYVHAVLFAMGQSDLDHMPREVMADIVACTDLYNKVLEEQRVQHNNTHPWTKIFKQICFTTLTNSQRHHPVVVSVKDLLNGLAAHHANSAANRLHSWTGQRCVCKSEFHTEQGIPTSLRSRFPSTLTWEQLRDQFFMFPSSSHTGHSPELNLKNTSKENGQRHPTLEKATFSPIHDTNRGNLSFQCQTRTYSAAPVRTARDHNSPLRNCQHLQKSSPPATFPTISLSGFFQQDQSKVELLLHVLVASNDLLAPPVSHPLTPTTQMFPPSVTIDPLPPNGKADSNRRVRDCDTEGTCQQIIELDITTSSGAGQQGPGEAVGDVQKAEDECVQRPRSVQWLDLGRSSLFDDLLGQYRTLLWAHCSKALWLQMRVPHRARSTGSVNLLDNHRRFQVLQIINQASETDRLPRECKAMLEEFSLSMLVSAAHAQWDYVVCRGLGAALKDKCLTERNPHSRSMAPSSNQDDGVMMSVTAEYLLQLTPPLLSSLSHCKAPGSLSLFPSRTAFHRWTLSLTLATVQLSTVWVMSKSCQFLSSWSLNKFLLITQGDLKVLSESSDKMVQRTKSLLMNSYSNCLCTPHSHHPLVLKQQLQKVDAASSELQAFSSLVLKTFSDDCKRMSAALFEQTMPSAAHWRLNPRPGIPISPSEYASLAAQNVIGQVLDGVALLSDEIRIQALSLTLTAFMEAWMEHILKQRIKFSVQGALQLKQDFDSVREFICSDRYGLPEELLQRLLSLRVFQQVDSAVLCLLQQPQVRPYLQRRAWEPFTRCCPTKSSGDSLHAAVGSSITNLRGMEGDYMTQSNPSVGSTDIPSVDPFIPGEPYLAPRTGWT
ncbi:uncharacterized protein ccdc142 isoform X2 [Phycodurus eques]|uniref:uncharacterized protein ccdc142 isoform X2 n=1 Tax=Phycodurus eques TaxID=693459 RepID=UPI002ACD2664|nr:uncharacterized protein ccdc142 isoform X2 [Phycodurus eques]